MLAQLPEDVHSCEIQDISLGGAKLRFDSAVPPGRDITLGHPDLAPLKAERLWHNRELVGIQFDFSEDSLAFISHCLRTMLEIERTNPRS